MQSAGRIDQHHIDLIFLRILDGIKSHRSSIGAIGMLDDIDIQPLRMLFQLLDEHAQRLNVNIIKHTYGADAAAVAFDAIKYAEKNKIDVVLIDTAGRLHSNVNLMAELEKIIRVAKPQLKLFVGESITGNDCVEQAQQFHQHLEMDGIILTKADVDEKGGAPLSIAYTVKKPIFFLGVGQRSEDLESFDREKVLQQLGL